MKTLLSIVQEILADSNGDEINSISDTVEATQCAKTVASVHLDIMSEFDLQSGKQMFRLTASGTSSRPTHMSVPANYHSVEWVKYDVRTSVGADRDMKDIVYCTPKEFLDITDQRLASDDTVDVVTDPSGVVLNIFNNRAPIYFTMFDDDTVVFDAYNSDLEATLQASKSQAYGQVAQELTIEDETEIQLPYQLVPLLVNEARLAYTDLHAGGATLNTNVRARRSRVRAQRLRHTLRNNREQFKHTGPDYGRRPR